MPRDRWQQWDLTSRDPWPQMGMGLCFTRCHIEYFDYIIPKWGYHCVLEGPDWMCSWHILVSWIDIPVGNFQLPSWLSRESVCSTQRLTTSLLLLQKALFVLFFGCFFFSPRGRNSLCWGFFRPSPSLGCWHSWGQGGQEPPSPPLSAAQQQTIQFNAHLLRTYYVH